MILYRILRPIVVFLFRLVYRRDVRGRENVPETGAVIICADHLHIFDPVLIASAVKRPIHFVAKDELFRGRFRSWLFNGVGAIPVHRDGSDLAGLKKGLTVLRKGEALGIFPEGTRRKNGVSAPFKAGAAVFALRSGAPLIPAYIEGSYRAFSKLRLVFGPPVDFSAYEGKKLSADDYERIAREDIQSAVYALGEGYEDNNS